MLRDTKQPELRMLHLDNPLLLQLDHPSMLHLDNPLLLQLDYQLMMQQLDYQLMLPQSVLIRVTKCMMASLLDKYTRACS